MTTQLVDVERWRRWRAGRSGTRCWREWSERHPALLGWSVPELASPASSLRTDSMQAALVALAQGGEGQAALTLLVQLRPGLGRLARWATAVGLWPWAEAVDEVRAVFFETLYRHPLDRRPAKIAANLLLDTRQRVQRSEARSAKVRAAVLAEAEAQRGNPSFAVAAVDPPVELAVVGAIRAAVDRLPGSEPSRQLTATLAYRAWVLDEPRAAIAAELGIGPAAVTARLHRLRAVMRQQDQSVRESA